MFPPRGDILRLAPELVLCFFGILLMLVEPFLTHARRGILLFLATTGAALALVATILPAMYPGPAFSGLLSIDAFSVFVHAVVGVVALLVVLGSADYLDRETFSTGSITRWSCLPQPAWRDVLRRGTDDRLRGSRGQLDFHLHSRRLPPRCASLRRGGMKYFLLGSFATAFFLYGVALVYGATGTTLITQAVLTNLPVRPRYSGLAWR